MWDLLLCIQILELSQNVLNVEKTVDSAQTPQNKQIPVPVCRKFFFVQFKCMIQNNHSHSLNILVLPKSGNYINIK